MLFCLQQIIDYLLRYFSKQRDSLQAYRPQQWHTWSSKHKKYFDLKKKKEDGNRIKKQCSKKLQRNCKVFIKLSKNYTLF